MSKREPGYCLHKPSGQAYVNLGGKVIYLGEYDGPESHKAYNKIKSEWLVNRHSSKFRRTGLVTMAELFLAYLDHAEPYYGTDSTELANLKLAIKSVASLYSELSTADFGPLEFETVRNYWVTKQSGKRGNRTCSRQYCNVQMKRLVRIVKFGVAKGLVPPSVHQVLKCIDPLKRGRGSSPESAGVLPVTRTDVEATVRFLTPVVADMVRVQLLLGCRPGELVQLTPGMIDRSGDVWTITIVEHKTAYRGKARVIYAGPQVQAILLPYLLRGADDCLFSPVESEQQRRSAQHAARKTSMSCGNKPGSNIVNRERKKEPGLAFTSGTYARSIKAACLRAKVAAWAPNRLRHTRATEIRSQFGLEAASSVLGHSEIGVTQIYALADQERAVQVAKQIG